MTKPHSREMVLDPATADAIRQARRSTECAARLGPQTGALVISPEIALALQTRNSNLKKIRRPLWLALGLASIGWTLALVLLFQRIAA